MTRFRRQPRSGRVLDHRRRVTIILISALSALFVGVNYLSNNGDDYHYHESRNLDKTAALRSNTSDNQSSASNKEEDGMKRNNSLLNLHPASTENLPLCSATRISLTDKNSFDETKPTIFTDWSPAALENWKDRMSFIQRFGSHPQYVKGGDVQPLQNARGEKCTARTSILVDTMRERFDNDENNVTGDVHGRQMKDDLLFFTNDVENPTFMESILKDVSVPAPISQHSAWAGENMGFSVFSAMEQGSSHPFHFHEAAWLGQVSGARLWYILPPGTSKKVVGAKVNGCDYFTGAAALPSGAKACIQRSGEVFYLPPSWLHATCALEPFSVGVGGQGGSPKGYEQDFPIPTVPNEWTEAKERAELAKCSAAVKKQTQTDGAKITSVKEKKDDEQQNWKWFDGNIGEYYDKLERDEHAKRNPNVITSYAVHRWMGPQRKTLDHYILIRKAIYEMVLGRLPPPGEEVTSTGEESYPLRVFDGGCGLGAGLMWFEEHERTWSMTGHTISQEQYTWITKDLPEHKFNVRLLTYDKPLGENESDDKYHAIYSIEASIHSPNLSNTIKAWSDALEPGGVIVIIDDFLSVGVSRDDPDVDLFAKSWIANSVHSTTEVADMAEKNNMALVQDRDLGSQYSIAKLNYRNKAPKLRDEAGRVHQGWLGSKARQKLFLDGKITYRMIVLQKHGDISIEAEHATCAAVATSHEDETLAVEIRPTLMTGKGKEGGAQQECLSGWYCCGKGEEYWDDMAATRTESTKFLTLPRELFGDYLTSFAKHLTEFYQTYPADYPGQDNKKGIFLDIGGTGSVASGMTMVTSKFAHFAGPLDYWVLDSEPSAKKLSNAIVCDIDDCPAAQDCSYDVTFSFTVLEHAARPWKSFDTIARITKKGGLTLHLVPWSYQWHATPADNYRFSHTALTTLIQDRGFEVLDVGYDICNQPELVRQKRKDEHFEVIWLTYVVGRKL